MSGYDEFGRDDHLGDPSDPGPEPEPAMTAEQGDVEVIRKAVDEQVFGSVYRKEILAALDRLVAALDRAELALEGERSGAAIDFARAEKAERALAETRQNVEQALDELEAAGSDPAPLRVVRFALRPPRTPAMRAEGERVAHEEAVEKAKAFVRGEVRGKCCDNWPECSHVFEAVTGEPWSDEPAPLPAMTEGERVAVSGAEIDELLDVITRLVGFSRAGTFDEDPGELEAWRDALEVLGRYAPQPPLARDPEWPDLPQVC